MLYIYMYVSVCRGLVTSCLIHTQIHKYTHDRYPPINAMEFLLEKHRLATGGGQGAS